MKLGENMYSNEAIHFFHRKNQKVDGMVPLPFLEPRASIAYKITRLDPNPGSKWTSIANAFNMLDKLAITHLNNMPEKSDNIKNWLIESYNKIFTAAKLCFQHKGPEVTKSELKTSIKTVFIESVKKIEQVQDEPRCSPLGT